MKNFIYLLKEWQVFYDKTKNVNKNLRHRHQIHPHLKLPYLIQRIHFLCKYIVPILIMMTNTNCHKKKTNS